MLISDLPCMQLGNVHLLALQSGIIRRMSTKYEEFDLEDGKIKPASSYGAVKSINIENGNVGNL